MIEKKPTDFSITRLDIIQEEHDEGDEIIAELDK